MQYFLMALRAIGTLAYNPILGRTQLEAEKIRKLTDMLAFLAEQGEEGYAELKAFAEEVKALAEQGIDPSAEQWAALTDRDKSARATIAENKRRLLAEAGGAPVADPQG